MPARLVALASLATMLALQEGSRPRPAPAPLVTQGRTEIAQVPAQGETTGVFILARTIVPRLPPAPLIWRLERFPSEAAARGAARPASVVVKADRKTWLFTVVGQHGRSGRGAGVAGRDLRPAAPAP